MDRATSANHNQLDMLMLVTDAYQILMLFTTPVFINLATKGTLDVLITSQFPLDAKLHKATAGGGRAS